MKTVTVRGTEIGNGMPKICVPVAAPDLTAALEQAEAAMRSPADIIEWRADYFPGNLPENQIVKAATELWEHLPGKVLLFTFRTKDEGGEREVTDKEYVRICKNAVDTGRFDLIDIQISRPQNVVASLTSYAQTKSVKVISSFHDFRRTPSEEEMAEKLREMQNSGADIVKIAVTPEIPDDVLALLRASAAFRATKNTAPIISISMGTKGTVSRISGEIFGSAVTFASAGATSAPGQLAADEVDSLLISIHRMNSSISAEKFRFRKRRRNENIVLIGFMGTGKSMISKILSQTCGMRAVELDYEIEKAAGMPISEIFRRKGEAYFRDLETAQTKTVAAMKNVVISCGGGTVLRRENVEALKSSGYVIMLRAKPETVFERVRHNPEKRPLLARYMSRGYISWLMKQREEKYVAAADLIIDVDGRESAQTAEILSTELELGRPGRK